jgi:uncharacterized protein with PIN domain
MRKHDQFKKLKETIARKEHNCDYCNEIISNGDLYYKEYIDDKFLQTLHAKKYCKKCYDKIGYKLLQF